LEERKVVTVLFCDLVGFTAVSERADPEDVRAILRTYHGRLKHDIETFGGTVEKFIGDAVMAVFGAPRAHEDDPERAVRAGLAILESITSVNEGDPGADLAVRVGVNTGETLVSLSASPERGEGMVAGDVVNTAARLQSIAPVNSVVVGVGTYRATRSVFEYDALPPVLVKGKSAPVPLWRAARSERSTSLEAGVSPPPFVGRELELAGLIDVFHQCSVDSAVRLVTVVGEPGSGKTRLLQELRKTLESRGDPHIWRRGRCPAYGDGITFWALGEILKKEAGILESDSAATVAAKLKTATRMGQDREWIYQRLLPLVGSDASSVAEREESFAAWLKFLEAIARKAPAVFVFEDLHWANQALLDFIEYVAANSMKAPMVLLCSTRPQLLDRRPSWMASLQQATLLELAPLRHEETTRLISNLLDGAMVSADLRTPILEAAGGNPLFAEEFVRLLKDRDLLVVRDATVNLRAESDIPTPESIVGLITARLDTLPSERKQLLADAAVIGRVFWTGALSAVADRDPSTIDEAMGALSVRELVRRESTSSMEGQAEYGFWHVLVRDVAYAQIPRALRAEKHLKAASWLSSAATDRIQDVAEALAYHYVQAMTLARASGRVDQAEEAQGMALQFLIASGDRALGLDVERAGSYFAQALDFLPPEDVRRPELLARWAKATRQAGHLRAAFDALEEAVASSLAQGDKLLAARTMLTLSGLTWDMGDPRTWSLRSEAVAMLEAEGPSSDLVRAYAGMADGSGPGGYEEAVELAERAISLADELGLEEPARAIGNRGTARCALGFTDGAAELRRALTLAKERGQSWDAALLYDNLGESLSLTQGPAALLKTLEEGILFARSRGIAEFVEWMTVERLDPLFDLGSWQELVHEAERIGGLLESSEETVELIQVRALHARVLALQGRSTKALPLAEWAIQAARESGDGSYIGFTTAVAAAVRMAAGQVESSLALVEEFSRGGYAKEPFFGSVLPAVVRVAVDAGDLDLAEGLIQGLDPLHAWAANGLFAAEPIVAEARGEEARAARGYADAAERWARFGVVPERGFALLGEGRCLAGIDQREAVTILRVATEVLRPLGAQPAIVEAEAILRDLVAASS
jgi:class 3 adenylate cyclase/tetratricopeptide (TPR) repeat protein